jgi:hypothetical protein
VICAKPRPGLSLDSNPIGAHMSDPDQDRGNPSGPIRRPGNITAAAVLAFVLCGPGSVFRVGGLWSVAYFLHFLPGSAKGEGIWNLFVGLLVLTVVFSLAVLYVGGALHALRGGGRNILVAAAGIHLPLAVLTYVAGIDRNDARTCVVALVDSSLGGGDPGFDPVTVQHRVLPGPARPGAAGQMVPAKPTSKVRCRKSQHVQAGPRDLALFVCEECGATLQRRTAATHSPSPMSE